VASDVIDEPVGHSEVTRHTGWRVKLVVADDDVRIVGVAGSQVRELVLDPARGYRPRLHAVNDDVRQVSTMS